MNRIKKLFLSTLLSALLCFAYTGFATADMQALVGSLNSELAQVQFSKQNINTVYDNTWNNSYQLSVTGITMVVQYSEDTSFYKNGVFQDRYAETGTYSIDLSKVDVNRIAKSQDNERVDLFCQTGQKCITQDYDGIVYNTGNIVKTTRQGSKQSDNMAFFVGKMSLLNQVSQELQQLISEVQQVN